MYLDGLIDDYRIEIAAYGARDQRIPDALIARLVDALEENAARRERAAVAERAFDALTAEWQQAQA
jgi:hypothetical protein